MGLREDKKEATRQTLADAARLLTQDRPLADVTVDEIATAAGLSRRTFFNYFDSKEAALGASFDNADTIIAALRARPAGEDPWTALSRAAFSLVASPDRARTARDRWSEISGNPSVIRQAEASRLRLERLTAAELEIRCPTWTSLQARVVAGTFLAALRIGYRHWLEFGDPTMSPRQHVDEALQIARPGYLDNSE